MRRILEASHMKTLENSRRTHLLIPSEFPKKPEGGGTLQEWVKSASSKIPTEKNSKITKKYHWRSLLQLFQSKFWSDEHS